MTTVKEFKAQKELIMGLVTDEIINNTSKKTTARLDKVNQLVRELQPPRPTCATCEYFNNDNWDCNENKNCLGVLAHDKFGCIFHKETKGNNHDY